MAWRRVGYGDLLRNGTQGPPVCDVQRTLRKYGFNRPVVDGKFGNGTESAVRRFQGFNGLVRDGIVGSKTWNTLVAGYSMKRRGC